MVAVSSQGAPFLALKSQSIIQRSGVAASWFNSQRLRSTPPP
jgi:hypothetical protein